MLPDIAYMVFQCLHLNNAQLFISLFDERMLVFN